MAPLDTNAFPGYSWQTPYPGSSGSGAPMGGMSSGGGMDLGGLASGALDFGLPMAGSFLTSLLGMANANKQAELNRQQQQNLATQNNTNTDQQNNQQIASKESTLDPFRQQMSQAGDLAKLDRVANSTYTPTKIAADPKYAASVPQMTGGYSYTKSPQLTSDAAAIIASIRAGNQAPTQTNPANAGKTSALNLQGVSAGTVDPSSPNAMATGPAAAGSALGANPAANAIRAAYQQYVGREPTDAEINSQTGNGQFTVTDPRLQKSIQNIMSSPEAQQHLTGNPGVPNTTATGTDPGFGYSYGN